MSANSDYKPCVATIGFFDGVHLGHAFLLKTVRALAAERGLSSAVITFTRHPRMVLQPQFSLPMLTTYAERKARLEQTAIDRVIPLDFTPEMAKLSAHDFMRTMLRDKVAVRVMLIGYDHRFGRNRADGFTEYCRYGEVLGIEVIQAQSLLLKEKAVSSSMVRTMLLEGDIAAANSCLGYRYSLKGNVVGGYQNGRKLGFPTANLALYDTSRLVPAVGVYAVWVSVNGVWMKGMCYIGRRPTFANGQELSIEVHILGYSGDLYSQTIELQFVQKVRGEQTFATTQALADQLCADAAVVSQMLQ